MSSVIDPFEETRAKTYRNHEEIVGINSLRAAYDAAQMADFEAALHRNARFIEGDALIASYLPDLLLNIRTRVLTQRLRPYRRVHLTFFVKHLNVSVEEVEKMLITLILDKKVRPFSHRLLSLSYLTTLLMYYLPFKLWR